MIKTVLFDLDGTLLPMDTEAFTKQYFKLLAADIAPYGYEPKALIGGILKGIDAMVANDGKKTNSDAFWQAFSAVFGDKVYDDIPHFDSFYRTGFDGLRGYCAPNPEVPKLAEYIKSRGLRMAVATNPVFPMLAQQKRVKWAGLDPDEFDLITAYEQSHYCKPNPAYFTEILQKLRLRADECIMIGNDIVEDTAAEKIGIKTFILTDCLIERSNADITAYAHGGFTVLKTFIERECSR